MAMRKVKLWANCPAEREIEITDDEGRMLYAASRSDAYQPEAEQLDLANALIAKGWLEQSPSWPATLIPTLEGEQIARGWINEYDEARDRQAEGYLKHKAAEREARRQA